MDLWGPYKIANVSGAYYFLTNVDDFTRCTWTQLLQNKTQVTPAVTSFFAMVATQFHAQILQVRTDNGTKFINGPLLDFLASKGVLFQRSIVKTPQQNGVAERKHRHLLDTARAIKFHAVFQKGIGGSVC